MACLSRAAIRLARVASRVPRVWRAFGGGVLSPFLRRHPERRRMWIRHCMHSLPANTANRRATACRTRGRNDRRAVGSRGIAACVRARCRSPLGRAPGRRLRPDSCECGARLAWSAVISPGPSCLSGRVHRLGPSPLAASFLRPGLDRNFALPRAHRCTISCLSPSFDTGSRGRAPFLTGRRMSAPGPGCRA